MPQKLCPSLRGLGEVFYSNGSKSELLIRIWVCAGTKLFFFFFPNVTKVVSSLVSASSTFPD